MKTNICTRKIPRSEIITKNDFKSIIDEYKSLTIVKKMIFIIKEQDIPYRIELRIGGSDVRIAAVFPHAVKNKKEVQNKGLVSIEDHGRVLVYPALRKHSPKSDASIHTRKTRYYIDRYGPRKVNVDKECLTRVTPKEIAGILKKLNGEELIFYTGAGVSCAGKAPVWNMTQLKKALKIEYVHGKCSYLNAFRSFDSNALKGIYDNAICFRNQLIADESTKAHIAISRIVKSKPGTIVFTENTDLKHEAKGSRIVAYHFGHESIFPTVKKRAGRVRVVITAGLSLDDRGVINYLKREKPDMHIIALNLNKSSIPKYLDYNDAILLGDVQKTLPKIAGYL